MEDIMQNITIESVALVAAAEFILIIILLIISMVNNSKIRKLKSKYDNFMQGSGDQNIEQVVENYQSKVLEVLKKGKDIETEINKVERTLIKCVQKIGIVRYNAFDDVGSDLSFVVALMDGNEDGVLINGVYSRDNTTVYSKPLKAGKSNVALSSEEMKAIETAKKSHLS